MSDKKDKQQKSKIKLGYAPTRRDVFSKEEAGRYKSLIKKKIKGFDVDVVDIEWLNQEGLLYNDLDAEKVADKFIDEEVDALFIPHCNFGTEAAVARLGRKLDKPVLLWGPRDDKPLSDGSRTRDSQCGLFATSRVLHHYNVPFTYITNSKLEDKVFEKGFKNFLAAAGVVKAFKDMRIGQISTRPPAFNSVICDEGELLRQFGIEIIPLTLTELISQFNNIFQDNKPELQQTVEDIKNKISNICVEEKAVKKMAALKLAIKSWAEENKLSAIAIQCWNALQDLIGVFPCFINGELTTEGLPVACETDIHGAITAVITGAAARNTTPSFFADITIRHPENDNGELLWHCGPFPYSLVKDKDKARISNHYLNPSGCPGVSEWEIKGGDITITRFDGMDGKYSLFTGQAKSTEGPKNRGTYLWVEVKNWPLWEEKMIYGPYNHHCVGIHGKISSVLYEACKYLPGIKFDGIEPGEEEIKRMLRE